MPIIIECEGIYTEEYITGRTAIIKYYSGDGIHIGGVL
jgi:hypothetical protein